MPLRTMEFFKGGGILELRILTEKATEKKKKKKHNTRTTTTKYLIILTRDRTLAHLWKFLGRI
jgi:hypothetical protein